MGRPAKKSVDWATVETEFRTTNTTLVEIAQWYGITEGTIRARAKKLGWVRPNVNCALRLEKSRVVSLPTIAPAVPARPDPKVIVGRGHDLVLRMMDELNAVTSNQGALEEMIYEDTTGDQDGRRRASMLSAISLPSRAMIIKALATAAKTLADTMPVKAKGALSEGEINPDRSGHSEHSERDAWDGLLQ